MSTAEQTTVLVRARLILGVPALRARQVESQRNTRALLDEAIAGRGGSRTPFERKVLAAAALSTLTVAIEAWAASDGEQDLAELVDCAFAALPT
jgi:hypothetical protein